MAKKKSKSYSKTKKTIIAFIIVIGIATFITGYTFYRKVFAPNVVLKERKTQFIYIPTGYSFEDLMRLLQVEGLLNNYASFDWLSEQMHYKNNVKPGKYSIKSNMSNKELISLLRSGRQTPVKLTFSNIRNVEQLAGVVGLRLEADSGSIALLFRDPAFQERNGFTSLNSLSILIPNTYEFYWNTSAEQFYEKMLKEYKNFWTASRIEKAKEIGISKTQVSTLASIVEQETRKDDEKPIIAGVYMNRFNKGMKLEADPTLVYSLGDFTIRRVLNEYKNIDSPYNTYMYVGLPPGPICMPSIASLDAVLNYRKHNYLFFCAREDFSGYHSFAKTYDDHLLNARRFQKELNRRGIKS